MFWLFFSPAPALFALATPERENGCWYDRRAPRGRAPHAAMCAGLPGARAHRRWNEPVRPCTNLCTGPGQKVPPARTSVKQICARGTAALCVAIIQRVTQDCPVFYF